MLQGSPELLKLIETYFADRTVRVGPPRSPAAHRSTPPLPPLRCRSRPPSVRPSAVRRACRTSRSTARAAPSSPTPRCTSPPRGRSRSSAGWRGSPPRPSWGRASTRSRARRAPARLPLTHCHMMCPRSSPRAAHSDGACVIPPLPPCPQWLLGPGFETPGHCLPLNGTSGRAPSLPLLLLPTRPLVVPTKGRCAPLKRIAASRARWVEVQLRQPIEVSAVSVEHLHRLIAFDMGRRAPAALCSLLCGVRAAARRQTLLTPPS